MSDLASPPVQNSGSFSQTPAFADALQRAKQIAAKINPGAAPSLGQKRPFEGEDMDGMGGPDGKRPAGMPDPYGAQMAAMRDGMPGGPPMGMVGPPMGAPGGPPMGLPGGMESEDVKVPDRMVGLIIGRGGESINRLQSESGAKIQMSPHCMDGSNERICSITGARGAIERAKELIGEIINSRAGERDGPGGGGGGGMAGIPQMGEPGPGQTTSEMMVPSSKVGLIIGKGGETIKQLQDQSGSKMVVIQDGHYANAPEKPLRITGDTKQIERAKQLVFDLMAEKDNYNSGGGRFNRGYGGSSQEVIVPQAAVGVVIGKGGEMIKKVQSDTGANIQFQPNVSGRNERIAVVSGSPDQIEHAKVIIQELIESVMKRDQMGGGGRNGGWGGGGGGGGYGRQMGGRDGKQEVRVPVPAERCGIVIGKQGETIKGINAQTGAHCEMDRNDQSDPTQRFFTIRGSPEQVEHARRLISEKAGIPMGGPGGPGPYGGPGGYPAPGGWGGPAGGPGGYGPGPAQPAPGVWGGGNDHYGAPYYGGPQPGPPQQPAAPGGAPGGGMPQAQPQPAAAPQQQGQQQDYSAAWIEYYRSMGMHREADAIEQQAKANKAAAAPAPAATPASAAQPAQNGGGQPDYSAAWVEYYRTQGMIAEAEKLEQQIKQQKQAAAAPAAGYGQPAAAPQPTAGQQYGSFAPGGGYGGGAPGYGQPAYGGYPGAGDN